jgi:hypothetical protein
MSTKINEKGKRYGRLVVLKECPQRPDAYVRWRCRCDCGNIAIVSGRFLRSGTTKSCGCYKRECGVIAARKLNKRPEVRKKIAAAMIGKKRVYRPDGSFFFAKPTKKKGRIN